MWHFYEVNILNADIHSNSWVLNFSSSTKGADDIDKMKI